MELREGPVGKIENMDLMRSKGLSISESIGSDDSKDSSEIRKQLRSSEKLIKSPPGKGRFARGSKKSMDDEYMLDVAESIFMKLSECMNAKGRSVRGIFTKYAEPEMFPDRTVIELLSPLALLEGIKELGMKELQEFEAACLMRVLAKPEFENAIILNEFV